MTQIFNEAGIMTPVTLIKVAPCYVTQLKTDEKDGYNAVQLGGEEVAKVIAKPKKGHLKGLPSLRYLREFRTASKEIENFKHGNKIDLNIFEPGEKVDVVGISKGRGFAGVIKRHGFHGSPASHGHKDQLRMPGSIGSKRQGPVQKGKRMAGRMGGESVTVKNLEIVAVDGEKGILSLKGAVPGARNGLLLIKGF